MTWVQRLIESLESNLWKFVRIVHSANHEYPYHDYKMIVNEDEENAGEFHYVVGEGNVAAHGDQHKYFVSKRMLIYTDDPTVTFRLNHNNNVNVLMVMFPKAYDGANILFFVELHTNISEVFLSIPADKTIFIYCEGVLPQEARDAE